jgi:hypothetical protein
MGWRQLRPTAERASEPTGSVAVAEPADLAHPGPSATEELPRPAGAVRSLSLLVWLPAAAAWIGLAIPLRALLSDADRGLDLTDESLYLLAAQHSASSSAFNGVFGWYLGPWLRLLGDDIARLRVIGVVLAVAAALWLGHCAGVAAGALRGRPLPAWLRGLVLPGVAAAALLQYLLFLRTLNYDWFASVGLLLVAAGVALLIADRDLSDWWRESGLVLSLGGGLGIAAVGKLSTAAGATVLVLVAFGFSTWWRPAVVRMFATAGVVAALLVVHVTLVAGPDVTLTAVRRAGTVAGTLDPRHYAVSAMPSAALTGVRDVLTLGGSWLAVLAFVPLLALLTDVVAPVRQRLGGARSALLALLALPCLIVPTVNVVRTYAEGAAVTGHEAEAILVSLATAVVLALVRRRWLAVLAGLAFLALGLCFPLGTNNNYMVLMTGSAAVLAVGAIVCLSAVLPGRWGYGLVAVLMSTCVVTSAVVIPSVRERSPYRMLPLAQQTVPVVIVPGTPRLLVDPRTAAWVEGLRGGAVAAGWQPGTPLLDLTANSAAVLVLGAHAPGTLLPTFPRWTTKVATARAALSFEDPAVWRRAWLLVPAPSAPQFGHPAVTTEAIVQVLGRHFPADYEKVVAVSANFARNRVVLWRPVASH